MIKSLLIIYFALAATTFVVKAYVLVKIISNVNYVFDNLEEEEERIDISFNLISFSFFFLLFYSLFMSVPFLKNCLFTPNYINKTINDITIRLLKDD